MGPVTVAIELCHPMCCEHLRSGVRAACGTSSTGQSKRVSLDSAGLLPRTFPALPKFSCKQVESSSDRSYFANENNLAQKICLRRLHLKSEQYAVTLEREQQSLNLASVENKRDMPDQPMSNLDEVISYLNMHVKESDLPIDGDGYSNYNGRRSENMYHTQSTIKEHGVMQTSSGMYPCIYGHYIYDDMIQESLPASTTHKLGHQFHARQEGLAKG